MGRLIPVRLPAIEAAAAIRAAWDSGDAVLVLDPRAPQPEVEGTLVRMRPDMGVEPEVAAVVVTSGTAGAPKGVELTWEEGDAEGLPYADGAFDVVASAFGVMFAPRPERAAAEVLRVCRPGGRIALLNWTPRSFVGQLFLLVCRYAPLPPQVRPPVLWGVEASVREYLGAGVADLCATPRVRQLAYPFGPAAVADLYITNLGAIQRAYAGLAPERQGALRHDLTTFFAENNRAGDGTTRLDAECLEAVATRA